MNVSCLKCWYFPDQRRRFPEYSNLHSRRSENFKFHTCLEKDSGKFFIHYMTSKLKISSFNFLLPLEGLYLIFFALTGPQICFFYGLNNELLILFQGIFEFSDVILSSLFLCTCIHWRILVSTIINL
jgi:hypothetical protein